MAPADAAVTATEVRPSARREVSGVMGCRGSITVVGPPAGDAHRLLTVAEWRLRELESRWSRFLPDSEITGLGHALGHPLAVSEPTRTLVRALVDAHDATDGVFDPRRLPELVDLGYAASVLDPSAVTEIAPDRPTDYDLADVLVDEEAGTVRLPTGATLDPGGLGKGLAADLVVAELLDRGCAGAMVEIGGDLRVAGLSPSGPGWRIDVEDPTGSGRPRGVVSILDGGVATSSRLHRRWTAPDGTERHHLIDPATGLPAGGDVVTATVVSATGAWSEAFSKLPLVLGSERALAILDAESVAALLVLGDGSTRATRAWVHVAEPER